MPENIFRGNLSREDESKYGKENCWYEWSIENWGTKWNAYETALMEDNGKIVCMFQTAWAYPEPIIKKLAEMFPDLNMHHSYADEDTGSNSGHNIIEKGFAYNLPLHDQAAYDNCYRLEGMRNHAENDFDL